MKDKKLTEIEKEFWQDFNLERERTQGIFKYFIDRLLKRAVQSYAQYKLKEAKQKAYEIAYQDACKRFRERENTLLEIEKEKVLKEVLRKIDEEIFWETLSDWQEVKLSDWEKLKKKILKNEIK